MAENTLKKDLETVVVDGRKKQAETNEDGSKKYTEFEVMSSLNINPFVSKNYQNLSYVSWADGLHILKHLYPDAYYTIHEFDTFIEDKHGNLHPTKLPYLYDPILGYLVKVSVTINARTESCMLPVFDSSYLAKKSVPYVNSKKKSGNVEVANMGDINYAHQRALVKCLALHGLGDYLYRGESLPSGTAEIEPEVLKGQYVKEEVESLRNAISKQIADNKGQYNPIPPTPDNTALYNNGGDNRGYVSQLMEMARGVQINPMEYIKTIPQGDK